MSQDSFKKRYFFKLLFSFFNPLTGLLTQMMVPGSLGPQHYGVFMYLQNLFTSMIKILESGFGSYFHIKVGKNPYDSKLMGFFVGFNGSILLLAVLFLSLLPLFSAYLGPLGGAPYGVTWAVALFCFFNWSVDNLTRVSDGRGQTIRAESLKFLNKISWVLVIFGLWSFGRLDMWTFAWTQSFFTFSLCCFLLFSLTRSQKEPFFSLSWSSFITHGKDSLQTVYPILLMNTVCFLVMPLESTFMVSFYGAAQQGYFSLAWYIMNISLLFTSSMVPLLMRRFSLAIVEGRPEDTYLFLPKVLQALYSMAVVIGSFCFFQSDRLLWYFGGEKFQDALFPFSLLMLYPAHQTYNMVSNTLFYAQEKITTYTKIGYFTVCLTFFWDGILIAPKAWGGLELGATGLALKYVLVQIINSNVTLWVTFQGHRSAYKRVLLHQMVCPLVLLIISYGVRFVFDRFFLLPQTPWMQIGICGGGFVVFLGGLLAFCPQFFGVNRTDLKKFYR